MSTPRRLPADPAFEPQASDWLTGEYSPDVVFREGKWWTTTHWDWSATGRDRTFDRRRLRRNRACRTFLNTQPVDPGL